ncbi:MAG TPA: class I SAM-dependent methyltransferase, partial [Rhodopila sp.]|nr:class I SAM-dependent methyltransferase [Rhodopila sp.]
MNWPVIRRLTTAWLHDRAQFGDGKLPRECPICAHVGAMIGVGRPPRWNARCTQCGSRERHRLLWLWVIRHDGNRLPGKRILHFAPEKALRRVLSGNPGYETADLAQKGVTHQADIARLPMSDGTHDVVIANHVLEHVDDDRRAMRELFRVLKPGGIALLTVPINPSRAETYEDPAIA